MRRYGRDEASGSKREELTYVSPGSVNYYMEDIDFLLPWLGDLREGAGPKDPSSRTPTGGRGSKDYAHYEAWCRVAAEIDRRLAKTGWHRYLVEQYYCDADYGVESHEEKLKRIRDWTELPLAEIWRHIKSAVSYISSGPCPRWLSCIDCDKCHTCRKFEGMERKGKKRTAWLYKEWVGKRKGR